MTDKSPISDNLTDGAWQDSSGKIVVDLKRTNSIRDIRGVLLALAYRIADDPAIAVAACVLVATKLSRKRLNEELERFRKVAHPAIASRIHFLVNKRDERGNAAAFDGSVHGLPGEFYVWLAQLISNESVNGQKKQLPARQIVIAALAQLRLWNEPPVTVKYLQETCRVSYPTVAAVLKDLSDEALLEVTGVRGNRLRPLTSGEWMELARDHAKQRQVQLFADPTGFSMPDQLANRLTKLQESGKLGRNIRIGGVVGASRHFPDLDITAAPRLDLSIEGDASNVAWLLDAGLVPKTTPDQRVVLAVHVTSDPWVMTDMSAERGPIWAGELECLADLIEMGFTREAAEMASQMEMSNKKGRNNQ